MPMLTKNKFYTYGLDVAVSTGNESEGFYASSISIDEPGRSTTCGNFPLCRNDHREIFPVFSILAVESPDDTEYSLGSNEPRTGYTYSTGDGRIILCSADGIAYEHLRRYIRGFVIQDTMNPHFQLDTHVLKWGAEGLSRCKVRANTIGRVGSRVKPTVEYVEEGEEI